MTLLLKKWLWRLVLLFFLLALVPLLGSGGHLGWVWLHDARQPLPPPQVGLDDQSRLNRVDPDPPAAPVEVIPIASEPEEAERQLAGLLRRATEEALPIAISGARHSMGGHTLSPGGLIVDMQPFRKMELDPQRGILHVGSGARWSEVIPYLNAHGKAVAIMQSNNDFTVGGSLSVNCHGWQHNAPPIASSIEAFRLVTADGQIRRCSREENRELFSLALGGYGLFGVILEVELRVVENEWYQPETYPVRVENYAAEYKRLTQGNREIGMAYGRISVAPETFLQAGTVNLLRRVPPPDPLQYAADALAGEGNFITGPLARTIFRASVKGDSGKRLRWRAESFVGRLRMPPVTRNTVMNVSSEWFSNRDENYTEILQEYFIPPDQLAAFLATARPLLKRSGQNLLNVTVRNVEADADTCLRFAREEVMGLVFLFHLQRTHEADLAMQALAQQLIDAALACGGTYYLPYRNHATQAQFEQAYPMSREFFSLKAKYDPSEIFSNRFYQTYGPLKGKKALAERE